MIQEVRLQIRHTATKSIQHHQGIPERPNQINLHLITVTGEANAQSMSVTRLIFAMSVAVGFTWASMLLPESCQPREAFLAPVQQPKLVGCLLV